MDLLESKKKKIFGRTKAFDSEKLLIRSNALNIYKILTPISQTLRQMASKVS